MLNTHIIKKITVNQINFAQTIIEQSMTYPDKVAIKDGTYELTYGELITRVKRIAMGFDVMGLQRGNHVIIQMEDCIDWPCAFLACLYANIIPLPVSNTLGNELFKQIHDFIECKMVIDRSMAYRFYALDEMPAPIMVHPDSAAWMNVSSGSTGMPKIAVHRHQTLFEMLRMSPWPSFSMTRDSTILSTPKMSWNYGLQNSVTYTLGLGATAIVIPEVPAAPTVFEYINRFEPDIVISSPSIIRRLLLPVNNQYTLPASVKHFNSSGEHLPTPMYNQFLERFGMPLHSGIGMMETASNYAANPDWEHDPGTVGKPFDGVKIKLVDDEIYVNSPANACYYYKNYDKTRETFIGEWVRTGDRGYYNERGNLVFAGRVDDVFKVNDLIVNPIEIESVMMQDTSVEQVAVARVTNAKGTNEVHAFIVPTTDFNLDKFKAFIELKLFTHQIPTKIHLVEQLAETSTYKKHRKGMAATV